MTAVSSIERSVGVIGLGLLGSALAERLVAGGLDVPGYDLDSGKRDDFERTGGRPLESAADVAGCCRCLLLVLPDDRVSRSVIAELESNFVPGTVILDATTGDADVTAELGTWLAGRGILYIDMTVSGSSVQARQGEAILMVGGPDEAFERCRPVFDLLSHRTIHTGPCGSGAKMKLVTNLVLGLNRAALAEGLVFARSIGLEAVQALEVLRASMAYSRAMDTKGDKMTRGDFSVQARLSQHLKDVNLMLDAARRAGQRVPLTEAHRELLDSAMELGLGDMDNSAILLAIEKRSERDREGAE